MEKLLLYFLAAVTACTFIPAGYADDVYVDINYTAADANGSQAKPFASIQTAINRAVPGDTVRVGAGVYNEQVTLRDQIDVIGAGYETTTINVQQQSDAVEGYDLTDCLFKGFSISRGYMGTTSAGGGIYLQDCVVTIDSCLITGCFAGYGGGIYATKMNSTTGSNLTLNSCTVSGNTATQAGAGVALNSSNLTAIDCEFYANQCTGIGGGIWLNNSTATIDKCSMDSNNALDGGGIYSKLSSGAVRRSVITANWVDRDGAGVFVEGSLNGASIKFTRNWIVDNLAYGMGAGVYFWTSPGAAMHNCIVAWNTSTAAGGAIVCYACSPAIINDTIVSNAGLDQGYARGGIYIIGTGAIPTMLNLILWDNGDDICDTTGKNLTANYSQVQNGDAGTENSSAQPGFTNIAARDYTLVPTSPCINTGSPSSQFNDRNGTRSDRGYTGGSYAAMAADVDDSGCVNILDLIQIRNNLNKNPSSGGISQCDVTKDGRINILDLLAVRWMLNVGCGKPQWP